MVSQERLLPVKFGTPQGPSPEEDTDPLGLHDCVKVKQKDPVIQSNIVYEVCGLDGVPVTNSNGESVVTQLSPKARKELGLAKPDQQKGSDAKTSSG